jgi:hypothetical protein
MLVVTRTRAESLLEGQLALGVERREVHHAPAALQHGKENERCRAFGR